MSVRGVFLGPVEVAGYYTALHPGLEANNVRVMRVNLARKTHYGSGNDPVLARLIVFAMKRAFPAPSQSAFGRLRAVIWSKIQSMLQLALLLQAIVLCNAFVFAFGATITWYPRMELRLLRRLGKRIVFVFHGSDSRPPYLDGQALATALNISPEKCAEQTAAHKKNLSMIAEYAHEVIDNPFSALLHSRPLVNWHIIGIPSNVPVTRTDLNLSRDGSVRILHSPSHPESKGTPLIRDAVARLIQKGRNIDYVEVIGQPHSVVVRELAQCDIVIDQAYADVPMAGFSTEAAAFGKASIVGGLAGEYFHAHIPDEAYPPVLYTHPDDIENAIDKLVTDETFRVELGESARKFINAYRDPVRVAKRMLQVLEGNVPEGWRFDPETLRYVGGFGPPHLLRPMINEMVNRFGQSVLQLDDKPVLRQRVLDFWVSN